VETLALKQIGIVVPTLGQRLPMLEQSLKSARAAGADHILLVTSSRALGSSLVSLGLVDTFCLDQAKGLARAITDGILHLPDDIAFFNWLGDDDLLEPDSLHVLRETLQNAPGEPSFAFGRCSYMDVKSNPLFTMPTGPWANVVMRVGPQLVSQPACLFRRDAFKSVRGLDESLDWAFDLDFLLKMNALSRSVFVDQQTARFRWHSDSLSVKGRKQSVREAQTVRRKHAKGIAKLLLVFNPIISLMLHMSGRVLSIYIARRWLRR
jgi:hypothetical protein